MVSLRLVDPLFVPGTDDADFLVACTRREVLEKRTPSEAETRARREVSERIAVHASTSLLSALSPDWLVIDANKLRMNEPGHDLVLVNGKEPKRRLRIQVKGSSYLEMMQFQIPADPTSKAYGFDAMILVDSGITLDRLGRFPKIPTVRVPHVGFYVLARDEVVAEMTRARRNEAASSVYVYRWWAPRRPGSKEERHQIPNVERYRNRFDVIEELLAKVSAPSSA